MTRIASFAKQLLEPRILPRKKNNFCYEDLLPYIIIANTGRWLRGQVDGESLHKWPFLENFVFILWPYLNHLILDHMPLFVVLCFLDIYLPHFIKKPKRRMEIIWMTVIYIQRRQTIIDWFNYALCWELFNSHFKNYFHPCYLSLFSINF